MAISGVPGLPTPSDPNDLQLRVNDLERRLTELPASLMQSVSTLVGERTVQQSFIGSAISSFPAFWGGFGGVISGLDNPLPATAKNIVVTGTFTWGHNLPATAGGTFTGYLRYLSLASGAYSQHTVTGALIVGQVNTVRIPFVFRAASKAELADLQIGVNTTISSATFNALDDNISRFTATLTYGLD